MGFSDQALKDILWALDQDYGAFLVTGPTGSGKTLIADYVIDKSIRENKRVIYTSFQKNGLRQHNKIPTFFSS